MRCYAEPFHLLVTKDLYIAIRQPGRLFSAEKLADKAQRVLACIVL